MRNCIELRCSKCGQSNLTHFSTLYTIWKKGYDRLCEEHKKTVNVFAEIKCGCGHVERYKGPMFQYVFQLIFDETINEATS